MCQRWPSTSSLSTLQKVCWSAGVISRLSLTIQTFEGAINCASFDRQTSTRSVMYYTDGAQFGTLGSWFQTEGSLRELYPRSKQCTGTRMNGIWGKHIFCRGSKAKWLKKSKERCSPYIGIPLAPLPHSRSNRSIVTLSLFLVWVVKDGRKKEGGK